jgi:hypothetical protein
MSEKNNLSRILKQRRRKGNNASRGIERVSMEKQRRRIQK